MRGHPELRSTEEQRVSDRLGAGPTARHGSSPESIDALLVALPAEPDLLRWNYTPDERVRIVRSLLVADGSPWIARFTFLLAMSVLIASLGLANDQPAAVIAAMVVAPMMTPVLGIATSLTLGLVHQTVRLSFLVLVASALAVGFGWLISASLVVQEVTGEELSRTAPRLRDMIIALAAGAAGMYSVIRKDLSGVVPGVAIAVALVPPLATIGILLDLGEWQLARGATLLYAMNVLAIVVAAIVVLLATDFMPSPSARDPRVVLIGVVIAIACISVVLPIWRTSRAIDRDVRFTNQATAAIEQWSRTHPTSRVISADITPGRAELVISGAAAPQHLAALRSELSNNDFPEPVVQIEWVVSNPVIVLD